MGWGSEDCPVCSGDTYRISGSRLSIQGFTLKRRNIKISHDDNIRDIPEQIIRPESHSQQFNIKATNSCTSTSRHVSRGRLHQRFRQQLSPRQMLHGSSGLCSPQTTLSPFAELKHVECYRTPSPTAVQNVINQFRELRKKKEQGPKLNPVGHDVQAYRQHLYQLNTDMTL